MFNRFRGRLFERVGWEELPVTSGKRKWKSGVETESRWAEAKYTNKRRKR